MSAAEPGEDHRRCRVPAEQLRNRDDRHFTPPPGLMGEPIVSTGLHGDTLKCLIFISNAETYRSMSHARRRGKSSRCCLSSPAERGLFAEHGWLNSLSERPGSPQPQISSSQQAYGPHKHAVCKQGRTGKSSSICCLILKRGEVLFKYYFF